MDLLAYAALGAALLWIYQQRKSATQPPGTVDLGPVPAGSPGGTFQGPGGEWIPSPWAPPPPGSVPLGNPQNFIPLPGTPPLLQPQNFIPIPAPTPQAYDPTYVSTGQGVANATQQASGQAIAKKGPAGGVVPSPVRSLTGAPIVRSFGIVGGGGFNKL